MTCAQSMARRRQARIDKRYSGLKSGDANLRYEKMRAKVAAEQVRKMRAKKGA